MLREELNSMPYGPLDHTNKWFSTNLTLKDRKKKLKMTILDFREIENLDDYGINELIIKHLSWLPETDEEKLVYINNLYKKAVKHLKEELFYSDQELWKTSREKSFTNWSEVIAFLKSTKEFKWKTRCSIAKYMLVMNNSCEEFNPKVNELKEKTKGVIYRKLKINLVSKKENEDGSISWEVTLDWENIPFELIINEKVDNSNVSKSIRDPNYHILENISDLCRVTFKLKNKKHLIILMLYVSRYTFKKWIYDIKNKWLLTLEDIEKYCTDKKFGSKLEKSCGWKKRKKSVNRAYKDIKLLTPVNKDEEVSNLSLEIKFILEWNENEIWLSMQGVYWYFKKISERIRTEEYIKEWYIEVVSQKFIENMKTILDENVGRKDKDLMTYKKELFNDLKDGGFLDKNLFLENQHFISKIDEYLVNWLILYYKSKLNPVKLNWKWKTFYTNQRGIEISDINFWEYFLSFINEIETISGLEISEDDRLRIRKAYFIAKKSFEEQKRDNNTSTFSHSKRVCLILSNFKWIEIDDLIVAILHDIIEDTKITYQEIKNLFWQKIANSVQSLSKEKWFNFTYEIDKSVLNESLCECLVKDFPNPCYNLEEDDFLCKKPEGMNREIKRMAREIRNNSYFWSIAELSQRDMAIKLADRLDALYTMWDLNLEKIERKIKETISYILPIAIENFPMIYDIMVRKINSTIEEKKLNIEIIKLVGNISYTEESFVKILKKIEKDFFWFEEIKSYFFQRVEDII